MMMHSSKIRPGTRRAIAARKLGGVTLILVLAAALTGCESMSENRLSESVHQPVVDHQQYQIDLASGPGGLAAPDRQRLDGWFGALGLRYGDQIAIDDPLANPQTRALVKSVAAHYGLLISNTAPVTPGYVNAGTVRVVVTRATATVPHCPDLKTKSETNFSNATSSNYGCAVNSNLAAMVANPNDLLSGTHGQTMSNVDTAERAIWLHQDTKPTGANGVKENATK